VVILTVVLPLSGSAIVPNRATGGNRDGSGLVLWARISESDTQIRVIILTGAVSFRESIENEKG